MSRRDLSLIGTGNKAEYDTFPPNPRDFGIRGMCAALNMTEDEFYRARRNGEVSLPDSVRTREPRWSVMALGAEAKKRVPAGVSPVIFCLEALQRAERAEGWMDEGGAR